MNSTNQTINFGICALCFCEIYQSSLLDQDVANEASEALCNVLFLDTTIFKSMFLDSSFCESCKGDAEDVVMLTKSLTKIQNQISNLRLKISKNLLQGIDQLLGTDGNHHEGSNSISQLTASPPGNSLPIINPDTVESTIRQLEQNKTPDKSLNDLLVRSPILKLSSNLNNSSVLKIKGSSTKMSGSRKQVFKSPKKQKSSPTHSATECKFCLKWIKPGLFQIHQKSRYHLANVLLHKNTKVSDTKTEVQNKLKSMNSQLVQKVSKFRCQECNRGFASRNTYKGHLTTQIHKLMVESQIRLSTNNPNSQNSSLPAIL